MVYEWESAGLKTLFQQQTELAFQPASLAPNGNRLVLRTKTPSEFQLLDVTSSPATVLDRMQVDIRFPKAEIFKDDESFLAAANVTGGAGSRLVSIAGDKLKLATALDNVVTMPFQRPQFLDSGRLCVAADRTEGPA